MQIFSAARNICLYHICIALKMYFIPTATHEKFTNNFFTCSKSCLSPAEAHSRVVNSNHMRPFAVPQPS
uniref:Putative secreted protein n=1 Tax=Ixodes scapularis TaxID=6945 RepID=A0A4D5RFL5_IXOSC